MRLLRSLVALAAAGLLAGVVLGYGGPLRFELDLLGNFRLHFLGLSGAVGILALLLRARAALWQALAAVVLAMAGLGPLWAGPGPEPGPVGEGIRITVMTANIYTHNAVPEAMRRALIAADPDILVTNETTRDHVGAVPLPDGSVVGQAGPAPLAENYPFHVIPHTGAPNWHTVIWSKFPVREVRPEMRHDDRYRFGVGAVVELAPGRELAILGLHVDHIWRGDQAEQIERMGTVVDWLPRPLVVLGDFNATAWSWAIHRAQALTGTRRIGGVTRTWSGDYPTPLGPVPEPFGLPIDHIMISDGIGVEEIGTVDIPGSDHDGVRAVLRVPR